MFARLVPARVFKTRGGCEQRSQSVRFRPIPATHRGPRFCRGKAAVGAVVGVVDADDELAVSGVDAWFDLGEGLGVVQAAGGPDFAVAGGEVAGVAAGCSEWLAGWCLHAGGSVVAPYLCVEMAERRLCPRATRSCDLQSGYTSLPFRLWNADPFDQGRQVSCMRQPYAPHRPCQTTLALHIL